MIQKLPSPHKGAEIICCSSTVAVHILGKNEVVSSILTCSTIEKRKAPAGFFHRGFSRYQELAVSGRLAISIVSGIFFA